jgi:addiction module HigA family antidote
MARRATVPQHPGQYVRELALTPNKVTVTEAAKLIGISRPGVSNFLNGNVAATSEMATRIERAFGIPAQLLLDMQAVHDASLAKLRGPPSNTKAYVPPFLQFKANDIEQWATQGITPRSRISVLIRTLVHSTGRGLLKVDFPGNDDAERSGWDGFIEASEGTPWIPRGQSGWEFGVNRDVKSKADSDYAKSVKFISQDDRERASFVFVTPRRWAGKANWAAAMAAKKHWKEVRAYDAQDLEQWLEQSLSAQAWLANETERHSEGIRSLDRCWQDWAGVTSPQPLVESFFRSCIEAPKRLMLARLSGPPTNPIVVAADSAEEALAFLSVLFGNANPELHEHRDRVLVFGAPGVLPRLAQGARNFIPVAFSREVERELGPFASTMHSIVVYPRNAMGINPEIILEPANGEDFRTALESMGCDRDQIARYVDESGRSLTVLRRRLSRVPAVRAPDWASDRETASGLIPMLLAGAWNSDNKTDQVALSLLANSLGYDALEKECQRLAQIDDAPVWSVGSYRGVVSKIDVLFAVSGWITIPDIKRYFDVAELVLSEDDPSLDLSDDRRWAAHIYGKQREFSSTFRNGISETLVLLAVYGDALFNRLGLSCEALASQLVARLLPSPLTTRKLEANDRDLPTYAEAAPNTFLTILERDLKTGNPEILGLLRPVEAGALWGQPSRTGLLWSLEGLAWSPETLPRSVLALAQLSEVEISDNWVNKPINSLHSIFRAWMPQTAATHDQRLEALKMLIRRFPNVAWAICIKQFDAHGDTGTYSHKPRWRSDGYGYGEPYTTREPILAFLREALKLILNWHDYSRDQLCGLIERLQSFDDQAQVNVWTLVKVWATKHASDADKAVLREKIRVTVLSRRGRLRSSKEDYKRIKKAAEGAYEALEPLDLLSKHEWLFREGWVEESRDEINDDAIDFAEREEHVTTLRVAALREVLDQRGFDGVFDLAHRGRASPQIGAVLTLRLLDQRRLHDLLVSASGRMLGREAWPIRNLAAGCLRSMQDDQQRASILDGLKKFVGGKEFIQLLLARPFGSSTWLYVDNLSPSSQEVYWSEVEPQWIFGSDAENSEAVKRLLAFHRPRAAFSCVRLSPEKVEPQLLFQTLTEMVHDDKDKPGQYQLDYYSLARVFKLIDQSPDFAMEQKAGLEFVYVEILDRSWSNEKAYGVPNLERYIEKYPEQYVQAIVWSYKRSSGGDDPVDYKVPKGREAEFAKRGHALLDAIARIPGRDENGLLKRERLSEWLKTVRASCRHLDRAEIGDIVLGKLLANAPVGDDGVWPCEPVRHAMEEIQSEDISRGARTGKYNLRGAHFRGEGGDDERRLAGSYRVWGDALQYSHPFVASSLLMQLTKTYEHEAGLHDAEAGIRRRLH